MKKIISVLLFGLVYFIGTAQTPYQTPYTGQGSINARIQNKGALGIDSTFVPPVYTDTFLANRSRTSLYAGAVIRVGDVYYYRNSTATGWLIFGTSTSNCHGTDLVTGSVTWSGTGLVYDATDLDYYILCTRYSASATTLTLQAADPTYDRIDVFYADVNGNIGIITGTPATNPQQPSVDPLTQINLGFVYVPAGSLVPQCTTATTVYNENVEWVGASNVSGIDFAYATNPYSGLVSTYIPNAVDGQYVSYQNGTVLDITDYQYLKFYIRLNAASATDPSNFLTISFFNGASQSTQDFYVGTGTYGFDGSILNSYQLVVIPVYNIVFSSSSFDKVNIYINGAPSSFQVDKMYLLSCASTPPQQGTAWVLGGNYNNGVRPNTIGTKDKSDFPIITSDVTRLVISQDGITESSDTTHKVLLWDSTTHRMYWTYQPTIRNLFPLVVVDSSNGYKYNRVDTADANPTSLATQYDLSQVSGGSQTLQQVLNTGNILTAIDSIIIDNSADLSFYSTFLGYNIGKLSIDSVYFSSQRSGILLEQANSLTEIGDWKGENNRDVLTVDGFNGYVYADNSTHTSLFGINTSTPSSTLTVVGLPSGAGNKSVRYNTSTGVFSYSDTTSGGGGSSPAGNEGNIQINRGGVFSTPASDSLSFSGGVLNVLGDINGDRALTIGASGAPILQIPNTLGGIWGIGDVGSASNGTRVIGDDATETVEITAHGGVTVIGKLTADSLDVLGNFRLAGTKVSSTATQLNYLSTATGVTGSGNNVLGTSPTFTTDLTSPKIIGGTGTTSTLTLQSTSGVGTTNADIIFKVGNNGATEGMRIANSGAITLGGALSSVYNGTYNNMTLTAGLTVPKTITAGGTTGAQTINKISGSVNFAAGASTLVVTNSTVSSTSLVFVQVYGTDATATSARVTLASGSFTITLNAAATAETKVGFFVTN